MKTLRAVGACAVLGVLFLVLPAGPASAHAAYKDSSPADESSVSVPPTEVWAEFTEPPAQSSRLEIFDPCGTRVDSGSWDIVAYRITTTMASDKQGTYTARFYVTSDLDSHPTTGNFSFTSTGGEPCPGSVAGSDEEGVSDRADTASEEPSGATGSEGASGDNSGAVAAPDLAENQTEGSTRDFSEDSKRRDHGPRGKLGNVKDSQKKAQRKNAGAAKGSADAPDRDKSSTSNDIPMDWLMISFGIAGAIGAAGGKVYAGLMGPRN